jgi:hypothetical protein
MVVPFADLELVIYSVSNGGMETNGSWTLKMALHFTPRIACFTTEYEKILQ